MYHFAFVSTHFVEFTAKGVDKGNAVRRLIDMTGIDRSCILAAGDSMADLPLLEAGLSFAVEHAPDALKAAADRIIPSPSKAGIDKAFQFAAMQLRADRAQQTEEK